MADSPTPPAPPSTAAGPATPPSTPVPPGVIPRAPAGSPASPGTVPPAAASYPSTVHPDFSNLDGLSLDREPFRVKLEPQAKSALFDTVWGLLFGAAGLYLADQVAHWNDWAWVVPSVILIVIGLIFLVLAPIHAVRSLESISLHPEKFTGRIVAIVAGIAGLALLIALVWQSALQINDRVPEYRADNGNDAQTLLVHDFLAKIKGSSIDSHRYRQAVGHAFTSAKGDMNLEITAPAATFALPAGTCLVSPEANGGTPVVASCTTWHQAEIVGAVDAAGPVVPNSAPSNATGVACSQIMRVYLATDPALSAIQVAVIAPTQTEWNSGIHKAVCVGTAPVEYQGTIKNLKH